MTSPLSKYDEKRDFQRTPEPPGKLKSSGGPLTFVVQKHAARRLHYDFRLEVDGVLKSWAVPNGPSLNPADKRLAVQTEDHPLDYASFEGVIPRGEYGGGQVIVWDNGTYSPDEGGKLSFDDRAEAEDRVRQELSKGKLSVFLRGRKLKGSWTLVKTRRSEKDWLLIKHQDELADPQTDILKKDRSVVSRLSIEDLKAGRLPDPTRQAGLAAGPEDLPGARRASFPRSAAPMLPTLSDGPFSHPDWLFEPKFDGVRAVALIRDGRVKLVSRRGLDPTLQYPSLCEHLAQQPERELVVDGEIVALDEDGRPSFQRLQQRLNLTRDRDIRRAEAQIPLHYFVFDLLYLQGFDLSGVRLDQRKALLESVLVQSETVRLLEHFEADGNAAYEAAVEHGLEGVVAKHRGSLYEVGRRSRHWLKVKSTRSADFVVAGYTPGKGARARTFGALALGYPDDHGQLVYAGNVGSGFDDRSLADLQRRLDSLKVEVCPFPDKPPVEAGTTWVRPELVAEIKYGQWTRDGRLRAPVFLRLRQDKPAAEADQPAVVSAPVSQAQVSDGAGSSLETQVQSVLEQLSDEAEKLALRVDGHRIPLTNLDKEFWPAIEQRRALTKRDLIVYFARVATCLLPHLKDRPLTLTRYPDGIHGERFYQKHWEHPLPEFVETVRLFSEHNNADQDYLLCNNLPTLLWLGQIADLELHTWYSRVSPEPDGSHLSNVFTGSEAAIDRSLLNYPDFIVFDLDPYIYSGSEAKGSEPELNRAAFAKTCEVALWLKDILDSLSLSSFVKTTGRTGLHIYVPILRQLDYDAARSAAQAIGQFLMRQHFRDVTMEWAVPKRKGKVFFDHNQNVRGKTLASLYSPRPLPEAAVSMPVRWDELGKIFPTDFTIMTAPERLKETGDLWSAILDAKHDLGALLEAAGGPASAL
jgi:bifunctional non-homologous end joining protein LigD